MPVTSTRRYSTTTGNSSSYYSPSTSIGSYRTTGTSNLGNNSYNSNSTTTDRFISYRSSSSYRNDTTPTATTTNNTSTTTRYGVSKYIPRSSVDKELLPPTGHTNCNNTNNNNRFVRSESRIRDKSLDPDRFNFLRSDSVNALKSLSSSSSFARTVATTGADFYEKYSPAHYIPKCELSRSRSLSEASKLNLKDSSASTTTSNYLSSSGGGSAATTPINLLPTTIKVKLNEKNLNNNLFVGVNTINTNNQAFGLKNKILSKKLKTGVACAAASNFATIITTNTKQDQLIGFKLIQNKKVVTNASTTTINNSKMINNNPKISHEFKNRTGLGPKIDSTFLLPEYELAKSQINKLNNNRNENEKDDLEPKQSNETELEETTKKILKKNAMNCLTSNDDIKFIDSIEQNDVTTSMTLTTGTTTTLPINKFNSLSNFKKENGGVDDVKIQFSDEKNVSFLFLLL